MDNIAFTFSNVDKDLVEYTRDLFFEVNKSSLETHLVEEDRIIELNGKHVVRVLLVPRQMEMDV